MNQYLISAVAFAVIVSSAATEPQVNDSPISLDGSSQISAQEVTNEEKLKNNVGVSYRTPNRTTIPTIRDLSTKGIWTCVSVALNSRKERDIQNPPPGVRRRRNVHDADYTPDASRRSVNDNSVDDKNESKSRMVRNIQNSLAQAPQSPGRRRRNVHDTGRRRNANDNSIDDENEEVDLSYIKESKFTAKKKSQLGEGVSIWSTTLSVQDDTVTSTFSGSAVTVTPLRFPESESVLLQSCFLG